MRVLLTGGSGLLGRAIFRVLKRKASEWEVTSPRRSQLDLLDQHAVRAHLATYHYDLVIHAAATVGGIRANIVHPTAFLADNALMNTLLIEEARRSGVPRFLFIGSSCMYPKDLGRSLVESDVLIAPLEETNEGYALAKITGSRHCSAISTEFGLAYRTLVPCNLYGPDDHFDLERGHLIASALLKLHKARILGLDEVTIWGDGLARREFLYADDLADFIVTHGDRVEELPSLLNVGVGADFTVNEYYEMAAKAVGYTGRFVHDLTAPVGMRRKLMDVSLARGLGWQATTSIEDGMRSAYAGMLSKLDTSS